MREKKLEVLAPAGSFESLRAAVNAGADAVYMGGSRFGARAYAQNPEGENLLAAIDYAHLHGVRLYLTVNTLLKTRELEQELYDYLLPCYEHGLDAVLVQDMGVLKAVREWFPDLPVHASTQMTLNGVGGVKVLKELGAERAVLSRELSLNEIAVISRETGMELETFVHGALCYCYSGQCLFSSILGGRSGNRGRCAQPCRLAYSAVDEKGENLTGEQTLLSPKDICALDLIPEIAKAGVYSLKIEGRMKRPEYTAGVVRIYRKYVDQYLQYGEEDYKVAEADRRELLLLFNRDGFSEGYYRQHNGKNMMALKNAEASEQEKRAYEELIARIHKEYVETEQKVRINGCLSACEGKPMSLVLTAEKHPEISVRVEGEAPKKAQNRPMEEAQFAKQLRKTGNTSFEWEHLEIHLEGNLFVPVGALNNLRREALEAIRKALLESFFRPIPVELPEEGNTTIKEKAWKKTVLHVSVETEEQLESVLSYVQEDGKESGMEAVYLEAETLEDHLEQDIRQIHAEGMKAYVMLPVVFREKTRERYEKRLNFWKELDTDGYVIRNLEEYTFLKENDLLKGMITDHNVYTFNKRSREYWRDAGTVWQTNPLELNARELKEISAEDSIQLIYGRYPMMVTAGCIHKTLNRCNGVPERWSLKDRYRKVFPVKNYCRDCYNVIYNSQPLYLLDRKEELEALHAGAYRLMFTTENGRETSRILCSCLNGQPEKGEFTRGHFKRGVE